MNISAQGLALVKSFEGFRAVAYRDSHGLWAVGYGHTADVKQGDTRTIEEATQDLLSDIGWAEDTVREEVKVDLNQNQFDALVSFTYNVGVESFSNSNLLRLVNEGKFYAAAAQFLCWDHIDGIEIAGLERRREAESQLFLEAA